MGLRHVICFGLRAMAVPAPAFAQADPGEAARNWAAIAQCGSITDAERRLGCMDDVLRRAGIATPHVAAPAARRPESARAEQPARPQTQAPRQTQARQHARELSTTIASVQTVGFQRLRVTAADGSVWEQTEAETFNTFPKVGDAFSVEPGSFGSTRCRFNQSSRYPCRQVN